jgi:uncharacterized protein YbaA (DUF1428 family)
MGKWTSFPRSVKLKPGETVIFSWITLQSARSPRQSPGQGDEGQAHCRPGRQIHPFDAKRMIYGGFRVIVEA